MNEKRIIDFGTTDLSGRGPGTYSGGTVKLSKDFEKDILSSAKQFLNIAIYSLNDGKIENGVRINIVPGVVCAAFSCELYFKWLIFKNNGKEAKGHKLTELFAQIDEISKQALLGFRDDFTEFLQKNDNLFVDARYHHEESVFSFRDQEILQFAKYISKYVIDKRKA